MRSSAEILTHLRGLPSSQAFTERRQRHRCRRPAFYRMIWGLSDGFDDEKTMDAPVFLPAGSMYWHESVSGGPSLPARTIAFRGLASSSGFCKA